MESLVLTVVDTTGIQGYVFGANQLRQISGASYLVDCATREWAVRALDGIKHNTIRLENVAQPFGEERIETHGLDAEMIYAGGGNTVLIFKTIDLAHAFTRKLTRRILADAPGLGVAVVHQEFQFDGEPLGGKEGVFFQAMQKLAVRKAGREQTAPVMGLGVTAECVFTSLPAVGIDHGRLVSSETQAKLKAEVVAFERLKKFVGQDMPEIHEFEDLFEENSEKRMMAVVHMDGNGMGKRIERLLMHEAFLTAGRKGENNRACLDALRAFSVSVQVAAQKALKEVVGALMMSQKEFRPIVYGGDDITFVCDARIGLGLTALYLDELLKQDLSDHLPFECRAGAALVHVNYPFARAYATAEELCQSARARVKEAREHEFPGERDTLFVTAVDWHMTTGGLNLDLETIRLREYTTPDGSLLARPLLVSERSSDSSESVGIRPYTRHWRSWTNFETATRAFRDGEAWKESHNKVKALRDTLRGGQGEMRYFNELYHTDLPMLEGLEQAPAGGWYQRRCLYYDAVEAADLYQPIASGQPAGIQEER